MDDLIARLKKGDEAALAEVMAMFKKPVFHYLNMLLGDRQAAEELTQDTFVRVYFKARTLRSDDLQAAKSWIYTIATNLARSEFRKKRIRRVFSLSEISEGQAAYQPDIAGRLMAEQLLAMMPAKWRVPLVMKEMSNFSFEEISRMLNKPVGTVKSLVFRGKEHLRKRCLDAQGASHA